jgi:hypothetical protein
MDDGAIQLTRSPRRSGQMSAPKIIAAGPLPPVAGEERDSDKKTMGVPISASVHEDWTTRKLSLQDLYPLSRKRRITSAFLSKAIH